MPSNGDDGVLLVRLGAVVTQTVLYITPARKEERRNPTMYKILKSTDQGLDELELGAECFATVLQLVRKATARLTYRVGLSVGCQY